MCIHLDVCCAAAVVLFMRSHTHAHMAVCLQGMDACVRVLRVIEFWMCFHLLAKDTLCFGLVYGLVWLVDVLHGDGVGELVEHPLLESLQPLVVMAAAHKLLVLQRGIEGEGEGGGLQRTAWG